MDNFNFEIVKYYREYDAGEKFLGFSEKPLALRFEELKNLKFDDENEIDIGCLKTDFTEESDIKPGVYVMKKIYYAVLIVRCCKTYLFQNLLKDIEEEKISCHIQCSYSEHDLNGHFLGFSNSIREIERQELTRLDYFLENNLDINPIYFPDNFLSESDIFEKKTVEKKILEVGLVLQFSFDSFREIRDNLVEI